LPLPKVVTPPRKAWCLGVVALLAGLFAIVGHAAAAPSSAPDLPDPPPGYQEEWRGNVQWTFPTSARAPIDDLQRTLDEAWPQVVEDLGGHIASDLRIRVGRNTDDMRALAPRGRAPPTYASGVAYSDLGLILLTLTAPDTGKRPDVETILVHELSHVALHRAVDGRPLPRWFVEGLAIHQAGEASLARTRVLWEATLQGRLLPLSELDRRFPGHRAGVNVAYAQATSLVTHLWDDDPERFRALIAHLREGDEFEQALLSSYGFSLAALERTWRADVTRRFRTLPLLLGGGTIWVLASFLVFVAYARSKRRAKKKLDRWQAEEAAVDRAEQAATRALETWPPEQPSNVRRSGDPPQGREPEVPTVRWEGRNHTLH
jgi:hypothetical protein